MALATRMNHFGSTAVGYIGHRVHIVRRREAAWLLDALGDVKGKTVLDIAGGDGYWAAQLAKRGAHAVAIDLATPKLLRGRTLPRPPGLVRGDALRLPLPDRSADAAMSMCAIEHFENAAGALAEVSRVVRPGGLFSISADTLSNEEEWPELSKGHRATYHVVDTFDRERLTTMLDAAGFDVLRSSYMFRTHWAQGVYLRLHRWRYLPNALAPLGPLVAATDRHESRDEGAVLLVQAHRR